MNQKEFFISFDESPSGRVRNKSLMKKSGLIYIRTKRVIPFWMGRRDETMKSDLIVQSATHSNTHSLSSNFSRQRMVKCKSSLFLRSFGHLHSTASLFRVRTRLFSHFVKRFGTPIGPSGSSPRQFPSAELRILTWTGRVLVFSCMREITVVRV